MRHRIAALAATTLIIAGGSLATATSASAVPAPPDGGSWDHTWTTTDSAPHGGTIYIKENGDVVALCDTNADGMTPGAAIYYEDPNLSYYPLAYSLTASGGEGSCATSTASMGGNHNLPEGREIEVVISLCNRDGCQYFNTKFYLNDH